jgi:hypothetical protein
MFFGYKSLNLVRFAKSENSVIFEKKLRSYIKKSYIVVQLIAVIFETSNLAKTDMPAITVPHPSVSHSLKSLLDTVRRVQESKEKMHINYRKTV